MNYTNEILLRRKNKIVIFSNDSYDQTKTEQALVVTGLRNLQAFGYTVSEDILNILFHMTETEIKNFYDNLLVEVKKIVGADIEYRPMYPGFPTQVAEMSDVELFVNAFLHYMTYGEYIKSYPQYNTRLPLIDKTNLTAINLGTEDEVMEIFTNILSSKTSISVQDKTDISTIIKNRADYMKWLPEEIPLKENASYVSMIILEVAPIFDSSYISRYFHTATDVLRLITALSNGDTSLATPTKYRSLRRKERRLILDLLSSCGNIMEDMYKYQYEWIRVGEILHPTEYSKCAKYKTVISAFHSIRNEHKPIFFGGKVEEALTNKQILDAVCLLNKRPGDFARRLDKLLRESTSEFDTNYIINSFNSVASDVDTSVLLQVRSHFMHRNNNDEVRVFFPKGNVARAKVIPNTLTAITDTACRYVVTICNNALINNYRNRDCMGKVYIRDEFRNYLVPFSQRSASNSKKLIVRGSSFPIKNDANAIRSFIWWTNTEVNKNSWDDGRVDIDLSACIYDENWKYIEHLSYTNLRSSAYKAYHSGDITNGGNVNGNGVAEFIDIDINSVVKKGRYVVFQVYSYTQQKFSELPNCRFGWMERENVNSGEIFEPKTVSMKMDLTSDSKVAIPVIFDCVDRKFIWCDMSMSINGSSYNNLESNFSDVTATCYGMTHLHKTTMYDLIELNANARGIIVNNRDDADIIFDTDITKPVIEVNGNTVEKDVSIITPFDLDYFYSLI